MSAPTRRPVSWTLIGGVSLPLVMLVGFLLYSFIARSVAEPPAYDAIFSMHVSGPDEPFTHATLSYVVEGERIVVRASELPQGGRWSQALFRLDHETLVARRIELSAPDGVTGYAQIVDVPELRDIELLSTLEAPDGYRFRSGYEGGPGLIGALFSPRRRGGITIERVGVVHRVKTPDAEAFAGYAQFLGWVKP